MVPRSSERVCPRSLRARLPWSGLGADLFCVLVSDNLSREHVGCCRQHIWILLDPLARDLDRLLGAGFVVKDADRHHSTSGTTDQLVPPEPLDRADQRQKRLLKVPPQFMLVLHAFVLPHGNVHIASPPPFSVPRAVRSQARLPLHPARPCAAIE